jgi:hypothetical protein
VYNAPKKPVDDLFDRIHFYADDTEVFQKHPDDMRIQNTANKDLLLYAHALYTSVFTRKQTNILTADSDFLRLNKKFSSETTDSVLRESLQKHPVNI